MSANTEPKVVVTGIAEDKYEYIWKIQNWLRVRKSEKLVADQKFIINTGKSSPLPTKWVVGLKMHDSSTIRYYCTLLENLSNKSAVNVEFSVNLLMKNGSIGIPFTGEFSLKVNETCEATTHLSFGGDGSRCEPWLDSNGCLVACVNLIIYRQIKDVNVSTA